MERPERREQQRNRRVSLTKTKGERDKRRADKKSRDVCCKRLRESKREKMRLIRRTENIGKKAEKKRGREKERDRGGNRRSEWGGGSTCGNNTTYV